MGRILIVVGVLMLIAAFALPFASSLGFINNIGAFTQEVTRDPTAAELCNTGETLDIVQGPSTRTTSTSTAGRVTTYFCVDASGERRDVTGSFVSDLFTTVGSTTGGIGQLISGSIASVGLSVGGIALIIFGALIASRGSRRPRQVFGAQYPFNPSNNPSANSPIGVGPATPIVKVDQDNFGQHDANSVVNFVRDQLDAAYRSGQISRDDYDRAIEKLNRR